MRPRAGRRDWLRVVEGAALLAFMAWVWTHSAALEQLQVEEFGAIGLALSGAIVARWWLAEPYGVASATSIYLAMLCVVHFGLAAAMAAGASPEGHIDDATWYWLYEDESLRALRLCLLGVAACALGATFAAAPRPVRLPPLGESDAADRALGRLGAVLTAGSTAAWLLILASSGGLTVFFGSHGSMLELLAGRRVTFLYLLLHIGVPLLAGTRFRGSHRWGWGAFALFSVAALLVGVRGQVMFTLAGCLPTLAMRGVRIPFRSAFVGSLLALALATFVRDVRTVGVAAVTETEELSANPVNGLMEIGASLRPVTEVVRWYESGDDFIWGASYYATLERPLGRFVPWIERPPAEEDERIMNTLVELKHAGNIGFSPIAEAFRNFGEPGVVLIMFVTGLCIALLDRFPRSGAWPAIAGIAFVPIVIQVRNSFAHVPFSVLAPVTAVVGVALWADRIARQTTRRRT